VTIKVLRVINLGHLATEIEKKVIRSTNTENVHAPQIPQGT